MSIVIIYFLAVFPCDSSNYVLFGLRIKKHPYFSQDSLETPNSGHGETRDGLGPGGGSDQVILLDVANCLVVTGTMEWIINMTFQKPLGMECHRAPTVSHLLTPCFFQRGRAKNHQPAIWSRDSDRCIHIDLLWALGSQCWLPEFSKHPGCIKPVISSIRPANFTGARCHRFCLTWTDVARAPFF